MFDLQIRQSCGIEDISPIRQLRYLVLREPLGMPYEETLFDGDENLRTRHVVAYLGDRAVGCLTLMPPENLDDSLSVQLRGMAVLSEFQGKGIGSKLLGFVSRLAREHGWKLWCKARQTAVPFYAANGWQVVGDEFEIPRIGPHYRMEWSSEVNV